MAGARPNFMKIRLVLDALEADRLDCEFVHTGQHFDALMRDVFFDDLGLWEPDVYLEVGSGSHDQVVTDRVSDFLLAPSSGPVENLRTEGFAEEQIVVVSSVVIDTLYANIERAQARPIFQGLSFESDHYVLFALRGPSNADQPDTFARILQALNSIPEGVPVPFPMHPRTLDQPSGIILSPKIIHDESNGYLDFLALLAGARVVITDSGGVQEETTALGVPSLTLRAIPERPVTPADGTNTLAEVEPGSTFAAACEHLAHDCGPAPRTPPLWDGRAGAWTASALRAALTCPREGRIN